MTPHLWLIVGLIVWLCTALVCIYLTWRMKYHPHDLRYSDGLKPDALDTEPQYEPAIGWVMGIIGSLGWPMVMLYMSARWVFTGIHRKVMLEILNVKAMRKLGR